MACHIAAVSIVTRAVEIVVVCAVFGGDGVQLVVAIAVQIVTLRHCSGPITTKGEGGLVGDNVIVTAAYECDKHRVHGLHMRVYILVYIFKENTCIKG